MSGQVLEAVLQAKSFQGFDDDGERCIYKCDDIVLLTRTQLEAFKDQFESVELSQEPPDDEPPPPPSEDDPSNQGQGQGHGHDDEDEDEDD